MKYCPTCQSTYPDETVNFCRQDGALLVSASAASDSSATLVLSDASRSAEFQTQQIQSAPSIAVLPFVNMSPDPENEYFCDGLAEELLNALAKIEALHVAARTSAFSFKGKEIHVSQIGHHLNVLTVLEGSVRKSGNRLRITAQLVSVTDGYHLWSERYDRELKDIFDIQDEISMAIVEALKVKLLGEEKAAVLKRYTESTEAYQLYLLGRFHYSKNTEEGWRKAIEHFEQAILKDEDYAPAWAGIANSYVYLWYYSFLPPTEGVPQIEAATAKALALDQMLAESHLSLAMLKLWYEWDWAGAELEFKQALALNPNNAEAHLNYCYLLALTNRRSEAVYEAKRGLALDPLSLIINYSAGWIFGFVGQYDRMSEQGRRLIELDPSFHGGHWLLGAEFWMRGEHRQAITALEKAVSRADPFVLSQLGCLYGVAGERDMAQQALDQLHELSKKQPVLRGHFALVYAGMGEPDRAFELFEEAYEQREGWMLTLLKHLALLIPQYKTEPRLADLLGRIGLPQ